MTLERPDTSQKATLVNLDEKWYGTVAEIGAGQETARLLFQVGGAAGTVAKTMSAYDMSFSDAIYGKNTRYVSRERLQQMLDHEYGLLEERLSNHRHDTRFFAFANTVAARSRSRPEPGRGWIGIKFQISPDDEPSQIILHVQLHDLENAQQQVALGTLGINLIYGAYALYDQPLELIDSLLDKLGRQRVEVDMIRFHGPCACGTDERLMAVQLVTRGLTDATMFTADGQNVQPAERLYKKPVLIQRGSFRPITLPVVRMLDEAKTQINGDYGDDPVVMNELAQTQARMRDERDKEDLLARMEILQKLGRHVLISNYKAHYRVAELLRRYTNAHIGMVMGAATLNHVFNPKYYEDLEGGVLEAMGRLFKKDVRFHVCPYQDADTGQRVTAETWRPGGALDKLYEYLREVGAIQSFELTGEADVSTFPSEVRRMINAGEPGWEQYVPEPVIEAVREHRLSLEEKTPAMQ